MNMIERVARAMAAASGVAWRTHAWSEFNTHWHVKARAAIEAMREPTEAMIKAVDDVDDYISLGWPNPKLAWPAMIDAALKEE